MAGKEKDTKCQDLDHDAAEFEYLIGLSARHKNPGGLKLFCGQLKETMENQKASHCSVSSLPEACTVEPAPTPARQSSDPAPRTHKKRTRN